MKKTNEEKTIMDSDVPIASLVIKEYKNINDRLTETNENLQRSNK